MSESLDAWLATRTSAELAKILSSRPDAWSPWPPRSIGELVGRLTRQQALVTVVCTAPAPAAQVAEMIAARAVDDRVPLDTLAEEVGVEPDDPALTRALDWLAARALAWPDGDGIRAMPELIDQFPHPHRLGPPMPEVYATLTVPDLQRIAAAWQIPTPGKLRSQVLDALGAAAADGEAIRTLVAKAPSPARDLLEKVAWSAPVLRSSRPFYLYQSVDTEVSWAIERGLLVPGQWQQLTMPAEIALALRGPGWRPAFTPHPPPVAVQVVDPVAVRRESAAMGSTALERAAALLTECAEGRVVLLKSGGVGVRELKRLAKTLGCDEPEARLWLEVASAADLTGPGDGKALPTQAYDDWRAASPGERLASLVRGWMEMAAAPLRPRSAEDRAETPGAALVFDARGAVARLLRRSLLEAVASLPEGQRVGGEADRLRLLEWQSPGLLVLDDDAAELAAALWREAHLFGAVAMDTLTPLGRAAISPNGVTAAVAETARDLLGEPTASATFQADLTVVVPGTPDAALTALLDGAADRESRGGASVWRFSTSSVRRALDAGQGADELTAALRAVAAGAVLPQPLEYLIADAGRRHGQVRAREVACVVHGPDPALLTEVLSTRSLAHLGLARLTDTVLTSTRPLAETLTALRLAGFAPMGENPDGSARVEAPERRRAAPRRSGMSMGGHGHQDETPAGPPTAEELAAAILAAPLDIAPARATPRPRRPIDQRSDAFDEELWPAEPPAPSLGDTGGHAGLSAPDDLENLGADAVHQLLHQLISAQAGHLSRDEVCLIADALQTEEAVTIVYDNADGERTQRVIEPLNLDGHLLEAWCRLRDDERVFALARIRAVRPV